MDPRTQRLYDAVRSALRKPTATITEIAEFLSANSAQTVKNWESRGPSERGIVQATTRGISSVWIRDGRLPMFNELASDVGERIEIKRIAQLPLVGEVKAGPDGYLEELQYPVGHGEGTVEYPTSDPNAYALRVRGDSMHPRYRAGEFVIVEPGIEAQEGDDVVVRCTNGRKMLKQLNWRRGDEVQLTSINNGYAPITLQRKEITSIQLVAGRARRDALRK